jgi:hypothetical protein
MDYTPVSNLSVGIRLATKQLEAKITRAVDREH